MHRRNADVDCIVLSVCRQSSPVQKRSRQFHRSLCDREDGDTAQRPKTPCGSLRIPSSSSSIVRSDVRMSNLGLCTSHQSAVVF